MTSEFSRNIFLTGFMCAGKSTVGKLLANLLSCPFSDIDEMIVRKEKRSISEIFATDGESYFRDCETEILKKLPQKPMTVFATGGGLVIRDENRREMKRLGTVIYLRAEWSTLEKRLHPGTGRPLVDFEKDLDAVRELWSSRQPFYAEADLALSTDGLTPVQVAQKIILELSL